jgi:hypothetical protein
LQGKEKIVDAVKGVVRDGLDTLEGEDLESIYKVAD